MNRIFAHTLDRIGGAGASQCFSRRGAFTLLETVIAMALLGLILMGAFSLLVGSYATLRRTDETLYVNRLMESALEMTRNLSFSELETEALKTQPIEFDTKSPALDLYGKNPNAAPADYDLSLESSKGEVFLQKLNDDLYRVTVKVSWTPFRLDAGSRSVATYISRNGVNRR